jgi:two-component system, NtrC family, sensor kinase
VLGWVGFRGLEEQVARRMQGDLELIARTLRLPLSQAVSMDQPGVVQETIDSIIGMDQVYAVYVYDERGYQVASIGRPLAAIPTAEAAIVAGRGARQQGVADVGREQLVSVFQPLTDEQGRVSGLLQVTRHSGAVQDYLHRARELALIGILLVGLLLTGLIVLGHYLGVGRHVVRIEDGMRRIRDGELGHRLQERGAAEFRLLAHGVNRMLDGIAASQREIERQRATEQALRERLHRAEKMATIGRLAAGVAHELGSPLATLYGRAQQLLRTAAEGTPARAALLDISDNSLRMEQTIRQLMDFGRANPLNRTRVDIPPLVRRLADDARARAGPGVEIEVEDDAGTNGTANAAPAGDGGALVVEADALRLEQAVRNLLDNAVHAAASRVRVRVSGDAGAVSIAVGDDGPGVPAEARALVFDPFFTTKPVGQGTGLGLSVASSVADDHEGELVLATDPLGGARFTLVLPREARDGKA